MSQYLHSFEWLYPNFFFCEAGEVGVTSYWEWVVWKKGWTSLQDPMEEVCRGEDWTDSA